MIRGQSYWFLGIINIYFLFCLSLFPNTFASSPPRSLCRRDQRDALLELQEEFPIHNVSVSSWNNSVDCCSWVGVTCDTILGVVISLHINSSVFYSNLKSSSSLFKLQHLTLLDLSLCNLQGVIPSSIGNLSDLIYLYLSHNHFVGDIPASFANLTKLSELFLDGNQFTGGLDLVLLNLTCLSTLDLSSNHFQSSILPYLSRLHNLENFYRRDNSFVGYFPSSLLKISSLVMLYLSHNSFGGQISRSIWVLHNLENIDLSYNNFRGQVPKSISKLDNLSWLELSYNKLEGQVPPFLWKSSRLEYVHLSHNSFNSFGDSVELINGASLLNLCLGSNSFQGSFPQWICKLRFLKTLDLSNNRFTGSIPGRLSHLNQTLILRNKSLSGFIPDLCIHDSSLASLDLSHNNLVGKLPKSLINCKEMRYLNVKGNNIKDTFPFWLGSLKCLKVLGLGANAFYGPVYNPSAYLGFPGLRIIDISNNKFVGSLPQDYFASWPKMSSLWNEDQDFPRSSYMGFSDLEYASIDLVYKGVDTDFARIFHAFKAIDFSENGFCGNIPDSIGLLKHLRLLNLSGNTFTGNTPPSLANITKLEILDLSQNNLSGEIPQDLGKIKFLSNINFSNNHLEGLVPQSTQFGTQNCSSFVGNHKLHGFEKTCGEIHRVPIPKSEQPEESLSEPEEKVVSWIAAAIVFRPGVFCGLVIGHIFTFNKYEWLREKLYCNKV